MIRIKYCPNCGEPNLYNMVPAEPSMGLHRCPDCDESFGIKPFITITKKFINEDTSKDYEYLLEEIQSEYGQEIWLPDRWEDLKKLFAKLNLIFMILGGEES